MKAHAFYLPVVVLVSLATFVSADEPKPEAPKVSNAPLQPVEETKSGTISAKVADGIVAVFTADGRRGKDGGELKPRKAAKLGLKQENLNLSAEGDIAAKLAELAAKNAHVDVTGVISNGTMKVTKVSESKVAEAGDTNKKKKKKDKTNK
jgi:hypothetical protein